MKPESRFHVVTVGWPQQLIDELGAEIAMRSRAQFTHIAHPRHSASDFSGHSAREDVQFFRDSPGFELPTADAQFLAALEMEGIPTIHNMILGDRVVCRLDYSAALQYATFLAKRLSQLYGELRPDVVIGGFDSLHGGLSLAIAKSMRLPWFALHFSVLPPGYACLCDRMSPAARVQLAPRPREEMLLLADESLRRFEERQVQAYAYTPPVRSLARSMSAIPRRLKSLIRVLRKSADREFAQFTETEPRYDAIAALRQLWRLRNARGALNSVNTVLEPPDEPYLLFGLHMQPESSIDVWAPFFSNQLWVIELLARSIAPTHKVLVKVHKSDVANWPREALERMRLLPGVELVHPQAEARRLIERAAVVVAIQGTMGLEAALLGRPVIMLGESPVKVFPTAAAVGELAELPALVKRQLALASPRREEIVEAYASYLAPFMPACHNDWRMRKRPDEIEGFVKLFEALETYLKRQHQAPARTVA